jgi:hypothetical protein
MTTSALLRSRTYHVELRVALEVVVIAFCALVFVPMVASSLRAPWLALSVLAVLAVLAARSVYWRWRELRRKWEALNCWAERPLRREGNLVIQQDASGNATGRIDTSDHYTVKWERFDDHRAVYLVSQRNQLVTVSTLAPDAEEFILGAFRIANYPCVDWPNFDL